MTPAERVQAVVDYGFTEREARFLVLVIPDVQFVIDPANAPERRSLWFLGLKLRLAL